MVNWRTCEMFRAVRRGGAKSECRRMSVEEPPFMREDAVIGSGPTMGVTTNARLSFCSVERGVSAVLFC